MGDASLILQSGTHRGAIYQGNLIDAGRAAARQTAFDVLVLCAKEAQHHEGPIPGLLIVNAPNDDDHERPMTEKEKTTALEASKVVASSYRSGKRVLVTCMMGMNRSGLVTALALCRIYSMTGDEAISHVRSRRGMTHTLSNPSFVRWLEELRPSAPVYDAAMKLF